MAEEYDRARAGNDQSTAQDVQQEEEQQSISTEQRSIDL